MEMLNHVKDICPANGQSGINNMRHPSAIIEQIDMLMEISQNIIEDEVVPVLGPRPHGGWVPRLKKRRRSRSQDSTASLNRQSATRSRSSGSGNRTVVVRSSQSSSHSPSRSSGQAQEASREIPLVSPMRSSTNGSRITSRVRSTSSSMRYTSISSVNSDSSESERSAVSPQVEPRESEFADVRPTPNIIYFDTTHKFSALKGFIETPSRRMKIIAALDEGITENVISETVAEQYGLEIEPLNNDEQDIRAQIENEWSGKCLGRVKIIWLQGRTSSNYFSVQCLVFADDVKGPIFGTSFIEKRDMYERIWIAES
jgi:hypothetical protein